jgi:hypothetical protein
VGCSVLIGIAAFLPWARSGHAQKTSFALVTAGRRLGVFESANAQRAAAVWFLVPLAAALVWLAAMLGWRKSAAALGAVVGLLAIVAATVVKTGPLPADWGSSVALVAGVGAIAGAATVAFAARGRNGGRLG